MTPVATGFAARAGMTLGKASTPAEVAQTTLGALGRTGTVLPGGLSQRMYYALAAMPRWARVRIMGSAVGDMLH